MKRALAFLFASAFGTVEDKHVGETPDDEDTPVTHVGRIDADVRIGEAPVSASGGIVCAGRDKDELAVLVGSRISKDTKDKIDQVLPRIIHEVIRKDLRASGNDSTTDIEFRAAVTMQILARRGNKRTLTSAVKSFPYDVSPDHFIIDRNCRVRPNVSV